MYNYIHYLISLHLYVVFTHIEPDKRPITSSTQITSNSLFCKGPIIWNII